MWLSRIESFQNKCILGTTLIVQRLKSCNISRKFSNMKRRSLSNYGVINNGIVPYIFICGCCTQNLNEKKPKQNTWLLLLQSLHEENSCRTAYLFLTPHTTCGGSFSFTVTEYDFWGNTGGLSFTSSTVMRRTKLADCEGLPESAACEETTWH